MLKQPQVKKSRGSTSPSVIRADNHTFFSFSEKAKPKTIAKTINSNIQIFVSEIERIDSTINNHGALQTHSGLLTKAFLDHCGWQSTQLLRVYLMAQQGPQLLNFLHDGTEIPDCTAWNDSPRRDDACVLTLETERLQRSSCTKLPYFKPKPFDVHAVYDATSSEDDSSSQEAIDGLKDQPIPDDFIMASGVEALDPAVVLANMNPQQSAFEAEAELAEVLEELLQDNAQQDMLIEEGDLASIKEENHPHEESKDVVKVPRGLVRRNVNDANFNYGEQSGPVGTAGSMLGKRQAKETSEEIYLLHSQAQLYKPALPEKLKRNRLYPHYDPLRASRQYLQVVHVFEFLALSGYAKGYVPSAKKSTPAFVKAWSLAGVCFDDDEYRKMIDGPALTSPQAGITNMLVLRRFVKSIAQVFQAYPFEYCCTPMSPFVMKDAMLTGHNNDVETKVLALAIADLVFKSISENRGVQAKTRIVQRLEQGHAVTGFSKQLNKSTFSVLVDRPFNKSTHDCMVSAGKETSLKDIFKSQYQDIQIVTEELMELFKAVPGANCLDMNIDYLNLNGKYSFDYSTQHTSFLKLMDNWVKFAEVYDGYLRKFQMQVPKVLQEMFAAHEYDNVNGRKFYACKTICQIFAHAARVTEDTWFDNFQVVTVESVSTADYALQAFKPYEDTQRGGATAGYNGFSYIFLRQCKTGNLYSFATKYSMEKPKLNGATFVKDGEKVSIFNAHKLQEMVASVLVYGMAIPQLGIQPKVVAPNALINDTMGGPVAAMCIFQRTFENPNYGGETPFKCSLQCEPFIMTLDEVKEVINQGLFSVLGYDPTIKTLLADTVFANAHRTFMASGFRHRQIQVPQLLMTIDNKARAILLTTLGDVAALDPKFQLAQTTALGKFHWIHWFQYCSNGQQSKDIRRETSEFGVCPIGVQNREEGDEEGFLERWDFENFRPVQAPVPNN